MNRLRRPLCTSVVLAVLSLVDPVRAAEPQMMPGPKGPIDWLDCSLGPVPGHEQIRLLLMSVGDRVERGVVLPLGALAVDVSHLKLAAGRLTGVLIIAHEPLAANKSIARLASRLPLQLELTIADREVKGTFRGSFPRNNVTPTEPAEVKGSVRGIRRAETALRAEYGLPDTVTWPSYVGPNQNFSSGSSSRPVVADLNEARLIWASEYIGPTESGSKRYGACVGAPGCAGGASPLVWRGKVYQFRYQPAGETYQKHLDEQLAGPRGDEWRQKMKDIGWTAADLRRRWAIDADEELLCIDAATGQTLWSVRWPGEGLHLFDHKCSLTNSTGVIADGKVFVLGALGIVRCLDADSGKQLWRAEAPGYADTMKKLKAAALANRDLNAPTRSFCHGLNHAGSTVIAPDSIGAGGVVGLDAATGKVLWRVSEVLGAQATPLVWKHAGKEYVIAANAEGVVACIDAASGQVLWRCTDAGANAYTPLLVGDLLVAHKLKGAEREKVKNVEDPNGVFSAPGDNYGQVAC